MSNAAAIVRPPGHHAESGMAMGFCYFNNAGKHALFASVGAFRPQQTVADVLSTCVPRADLSSACRALSSVPHLTLSSMSNPDLRPE